jgi:hypothetical protein
MLNESSGNLLQTSNIKFSVKRVLYVFCIAFKESCDEFKSNESKSFAGT